MTGRQTAGVTATLHVVGNPGGLFHLRNGIVISVYSAGSPAPDALLLRSGRISKSDWARQSELVARGAVGSTELQVVAMMAAHDAVFAIVTGEIVDCRLDRPVDVPLPMTPGVDPVRLLQETSRRLVSLRSLPVAVSPHLDRVAPAESADPQEETLTESRREILQHATGRSSARDIAFAAGRGLFPVTVEVSRMLGEGLLIVVTHTDGTSVTVTRALRDVPLRPRVTPAPEEPPPVRETDSTGVPLPRSLVRSLLPRLLNGIWREPN
ncbi:hypothetical protein Lesp02_81620 [Lentzea sp. NBRC 105346]|uniref:hypothetical protein n=1 Tax=Lentzea sp. NBRC 105346 TaxID=3032205 RepID=UPI0024A357D4|nr:hypothetical protein [Lentzea sp. NBRC 105346]GLZ35975.1 hypothetical protein Lesp02_81620 [Lentzea sp. NBRC 105346]